jgi:hypothetical protein
MVAALIVVVTVQVGLLRRLHLAQTVRVAEER